MKIDYFMWVIMYTDIAIRNTADFKDFCDSDFRSLERNETVHLLFDDCTIDGPLFTENNFDIHSRRDQKIVINNVRFNNIVVKITGKGEIYFNNCEFNGSVFVYVNVKHVNFENCRFHLQRRSGYLVCAYDIRNKSAQFTNCLFTDLNNCCGTYLLFSYNRETVAKYEKCMFMKFTNRIFDTWINKFVDVEDCRFSKCSCVCVCYMDKKECLFKNCIFDQCGFRSVKGEDQKDYTEKKDEHFENCIFDYMSEITFEDRYSRLNNICYPSEYFRSHDLLTNDGRFIEVL